MKFDWKIALGFVVSAFFLWWAFRGESLVEIGHRMLEADPWLLLTSIGVATAGYVIRAIRWQLFLAPLGVQPSLRSRWESIIIGFMVINIWPARLGEFARPLALARMEPVPMSGALGTVVLERVVDAVALLLLLGWAITSAGFPANATVLGQPIGLVVWATLTGVAVLLGGVTLLLVRPEWAKTVIRPVTRILPGDVGDKVMAGVETLSRGLELLRRPGPLFKALLWSLLLWLWMASSFWLAFQAFGLDLGFTAAVFTQCVVALFVALPAAPGFLGTFEAGVKVALIEVFGAASETTLSLAAAYHIGGFIPVTALGIWYAWRLGLSIRSIDEG